MSTGAKLLATVAIAAVVVPVAPASAASPPPKLPDPTYKSVSKEVLIPMDDGVKIAATVAFPSKDGQTPLPGRFPVVVGLTPYSRTGVCGCFPPDFFATRGMIGAVADVRGTGGSQGSLSGNYFSPREARDGYNVVEYFGTQPYSTGKVGMAGGSYLGITQYMAAELQPPHLAAITPAMAVGDLYRDAFTHDGIMNLFFDSQYIGIQGVPGTAGANTDPALLADTLKAKVDQSQTPLGFIAFDYLSRPNDGPFYWERSAFYRASRIKVPTLVIEGWQDGFIRGGLEMYRTLARRRGVETRLQVGPCTHKGCGPPFDPTENPTDTEGLDAVAFEFLRRHLLGARVPARPAAHFYLQNHGGYLSDSSWPPAGSRFGRLYLSRGRLTGDQPSARSASSYFANPSAGISLAFDKYGTVAGTPYVPTDQQVEEPQGQTFRTQPLEGPLRLAGPIQLHLVASSTANDTDWYGKLADVGPGGSQTIITEGMLRASHRQLDQGRSSTAAPYHVHTSPHPIAPDKDYAYEVSIWPTAYQLAAGHRLQLRVTSTDLPTHFDGYVFADRNNPAATRIEALPPATNTVREGGRDGSWLTIPVSGRVDGGLGLAGTGGCLARRAPIGPRNIGRVRVGMTRRQLLRRVPAPRRRTKRSWRWCVKGGKGTVSAAFSRKGRVALVATTAPRHGNRRIHPGTGVRLLRRAYPRRRAVGRALVRANPRSPRLFGVRRGRVRYVAVTRGVTIRNRKALRSYLRYVGLRLPGS